MGQGQEVDSVREKPEESYQNRGMRLGSFNDQAMEGEVLPRTKFFDTTIGWDLAARNEGVADGIQPRVENRDPKGKGEVFIGNLKRNQRVQELSREGGLDFVNGPLDDIDSIGD
jgi:hypothetical protein